MNSVNPDVSGTGCEVHPPATTSITDLDLDHLTGFVRELGWEDYRARQIFSWLWQKGASDWGTMTNLSRAARDQLQRHAEIRWPSLVRVQAGSDGTRKLLFALADGQTIESVYLPDRPDLAAHPAAPGRGKSVQGPELTLWSRRTVCVSTQVGCALGCRFCRTGRMGFRRNLSPGEIASQVLLTAQYAQVNLTNVVMMGMGEPLLNLDAVLSAGAIINSDLGLCIGARHITISTAGIPEGIRRLGEHPRQFKLAVSLNAADDQKRSRLMPINKRYPLSDLLAAVRDYVRRTRKRVTFEYVVMPGLNDSSEDARNLIRLLRGIPCKINLIPLNPITSPPEGSKARRRDITSQVRPAAHDRDVSLCVERFAALLYSDLPAVTIRRSRGVDIMAACGQLAAHAS